MKIPSEGLAEWAKNRQTPPSIDEQIAFLEGWGMAVAEVMGKVIEEMSKGEK